MVLTRSKRPKELVYLQPTKPKSRSVFQKLSEGKRALKVKEKSKRIDKAKAAAKPEKKASEKKRANDRVKLAAAKPKKQSPQHKYDFSKLKEGDILSCHNYIKVIRNSPNKVMMMTDLKKEFSVEHDILNEDCYSADHFDEVVSCSMTELSDILRSAEDTIFKVEF